MTVREAFACARKALEDSGIEDAPLESELLVRYVLNTSRVELYTDTDRRLTARQDRLFREALARRLHHEPIAYITGHREFYGLDFYVDGRVLIPRPETELIVDESIELAGRRKEALHVMADIGTGCGAIAVSLARHLPRTKIYATDASLDALDVAAKNCRAHGVADRVTLRHGELLEAVPEPVDLIVANLPYVRSVEMARLSPEIRLFEPRIALDGGGDGLDKVRQLGTQLDGKLRPGGCLLLEIGAGQGEAVKTFLQSLYATAEVSIVPDSNGIDRVVKMIFPEYARIMPWSRAVQTCRGD